MSSVQRQAFAPNLWAGSHLCTDLGLVQSHHLCTELSLVQRHAFAPNLWTSSNLVCGFEFSSKASSVYRSEFSSKASSVYRSEFSSKASSVYGFEFSSKALSVYRFEFSSKACVCTKPASKFTSVYGFEFSSKACVCTKPVSKFTCLYRLLSLCRCKSSGQQLGLGTESLRASSQARGCRHPPCWTPKSAVCVKKYLSISGTNSTFYTLTSTSILTTPPHPHPFLFCFFAKKNFTSFLLLSMPFILFLKLFLGRYQQIPLEKQGQKGRIIRLKHL